MNTHNPFAPPSADLDHPPEAQVDFRKPRSVWVVQIVAGFISAFCIFGLAISGRKALAGQAVTGYGMPISLHLFLQSGFVALLFLMLWQLPKRSMLGRNLGLALIVFFAVPSAYRILKTPANGSAQFVGVLLAMVIFEAPLAYWAFAFAFSEKARRYFSATRHV